MIHRDSNNVHGGIDTGAVLHLRDLKDRDCRRKGRVYPGRAAVGHHADVCRGSWIRLHGVDTNYRKDPFAYQRMFRLGDVAEYDSYNLRYIGRIVAIGKSTVTIEDDNRRHRLSFYEFSYRNRHFVLAEVRAHNATELECI